MSEFMNLDSVENASEVNEEAVEILSREKLYEEALQLRSALVALRDRAMALEKQLHEQRALDDVSWSTLRWLDYATDGEAWRFDLYPHEDFFAGLK